MGQPMHLYPLFFFILLLQFAHSAPSLSYSTHNHLCPHEQSLALLQFKQTVSIDSYASTYCDFSEPKTTSWNRSTDCCTWDGVACDRLTGHVIGLDLNCGQLQGTIHSNSSLFQLSHLETLNLAHNDFALSQISHKFGQFASLTHLNLSTSGFSGQISSKISHLSKLVSLDVSNNDQTIKLELEYHNFKMLLQNLNQLRELSLSGVRISSVLPMNLSSSFTFLDLSWTGLQGKLPDKIFHLPNLQTLKLFGNLGLTGPLPEFNASSNSPLRWLELSTTSLLGEVPDSIGYLKSSNYLRLSGCKFSGSIPESLGNLTKITVLDLSMNNFTGEIPSTLSNLEQLTILDFSFNINLEGQIPDVFANLKFLSSLSLRGNNLNGQFPSSIANLTNLVTLDLSSNSLAGPIPPDIVGLHNLTDLSFSNNSLNGTIPSWLFALPSLVSLDVQSNRLTSPIEEFQYNSLEFIFMNNNELNGSIPQSISKLANLNSLYLSGNNLTGILELDMFSNLTNLKYLDLSHNNLSVSATKTNINATLPNLLSLRLSSCKMEEFPDLLRESVDLHLLDLSYNHIHGRIPDWASSVWGDSFGYLNLSHNLITGNLEQLPWRNLAILDLQSNMLQGPLSSSICNLSSLEILDLSNNGLGGRIPHCLGNFSKLTVLDLRMNSLRGTIPVTFVKGIRLRNLNLHGNQLEGTVPKSLANCGYLEVLDFGNNQINDTFPEWLGKLPNLQVLVLRSNRFHGPISNTSKTILSFLKLRIIDLSHNGFSGLMPRKYFQNFKAMMNADENTSAKLYMGENVYHDYYDYVSLEMKGLQRDLGRILTSFAIIDLSSNKFEGEIPNLLGHLHSLRMLNLSHNSLVGYIPSALGNLSVLESLDLSSNQLVGEIPQQLTGLTFLAVLNLSQNHLVGHIPQGRQFNTFENVSYSGNPGLCGFPLSKNCGDDRTPQPPPPPEYQQNDDSIFASGFTWKSVSMGYGCGTVFGLVIGSLMFLTRKPKWFTRLVEKEEHKNMKRLLKRGHRRYGRRN